MKYFYLTLFLIAGTVFGQIQGLEGWDIYLDPGHSQKENMGVYGYSEAERNLRVGLRLREMLLNETDIDTVYNSRMDDFQQVSLSQRTDQANVLGTTWYHSIHSDAGASSSNSTLLLHGGWRENGKTVEKTPNGGKEMADYMVDLLTRGMRIGTQGNYADRTFYQGFPDNHANRYPYLHVNRETFMPSELSESGFHTNPTQNQLFMNADWKRLEARTFFWSILKFYRIPRPLVRILTGVVKDAETGTPLNGAEISVNDRVYITDTFENLFYKYTSDPDLLHNGFYYFEDIVGDEVEIIVHADDYYSDTVTVTMVDTFFTYKDFSLVSKAIPIVTSTIPAQGDTSFSVLDDIYIHFNRPMKIEQVELNLTIVPEITGRYVWSDKDRELKIIPDQLEFKTNYTITISGNVTDNYGHPLDGNNDGVGGDDFVLNFKTNFDDVPPELISLYPPGSSNNIELSPIVNLEFDEELNPESVNEETIILERFSEGSAVEGILEHYVRNNQSVVNFFPSSKLYPSEVYVSRIYPGIKDLLENETTVRISNSFKTGNEDYTITSIDNFESGLTSNWWTPDQSGTKAGYEPATTRLENTEIVNLLTQSSTSMEIYYDWDLSANEWILREYLSGGAPRSVVFNTDYILQVFIFGDGSGNQFPFAIDEGTSSSWVDHEVSIWYTIDWIGWKLVEWKLDDPDMVGNWIGNGIMDGSRYRFDSIQLTHVPDAGEKGSLYFDDLRVVKKVPATSIQHTLSNIPQQFFLEQNYPNPFNPQTNIRFGMPKSANVKIEVFNMLGQKTITLFEGYKTAGIHQIMFDGSGLPSGLYTYQIQTEEFREAKKMMLLK